MAALINFVVVDSVEKLIWIYLVLKCVETTIINTLAILYTNFGWSHLVFNKRVKISEFSFL